LQSPDGQRQLANLVDVGIGGATEGGREAMTQIQEGDFRPVRLAMATILGLAQNEPTKFGRALGFAPAGKLTPAVEIAKHLDAIDGMKADILATGRTGVDLRDGAPAPKATAEGEAVKAPVEETTPTPEAPIEPIPEPPVDLKALPIEGEAPIRPQDAGEPPVEVKPIEAEAAEKQGDLFAEVDGQPVPPQPEQPTPTGRIRRVIEKGKSVFRDSDQGRFKHTEAEQAADPAKANRMKLQGLMDKSRQEVYDYFHQPKSLKRMRETLIRRGFDQRHINKMINEGGMDSDTFARYIAELDKADGASTQSERATTELFEAMDKTTPPHPDGGRGEELRDDFFHFTRDLVTAQIDPNIKHAMGVKTPEAAKYLEDMKQNYPDTYKQLVESADVYDRMLKAATIDEEYRLGMISDEQYKGLTEKHSFYEPQAYLHHAEPGNYGTKGDVISAPIKKLDGGSEKAILLNSKALAARNITSHKTRQAWNSANKMQYDAVKANPEYYKKLGIEIWDRKAAPPQGKRKIGGYHEGGKEFSVVAPEDFVKDWYREVPLLHDPAMKMAQTLSGSKMVKFFATGAGNPFFFLSNIPMDVGLRFLSDTHISKWAPTFGKTMAKNMKSVWGDVKNKTGRYKALEDSGWNPGHSFTGEGSIVPKAWESSPSLVRKQMFKLQQVMSQLNEWSEGLTRVAYAKSVEDALIAKGTTPEMAKIQGNNAAKASPNFGQWGETAKMIDMFVPYFNPAIQATGSALIAAKKNPARFAHKTGQLAAFGFMLAYWNKKANPDAWDSVSDREKVNNFIITTPFSFKDSQGRTRHLYFRIRADQASRIFKQVGQETAEKTLGGTGQDDRIKMALSDLSPADASSLLPPTTSAILGYMSNKDFWRNSDIWQGAQVPPEAEYTADTPLPWVKLGEATGLSPERAQRATESVVPANPFTAGMGMAFDAVMPKDKEIHKTMTDKIMNIPGISRIMRITRPQELSKRQQSKAKSLKIDGKAAPTEIKRQIKKKGLDRAGARQKLNVEADRIIEKILSKKASAADFYKWLQTIPDVAERKRLLQRYKEKRATLRR